MYILLASITALLAVNLAAVFFAAHSLKKTVLSWLGLTQERISGLSEKTHSMGALLKDLRRDLAGMEDQRKKDAAALEKEIVNRADANLFRETDTVKSLSGLWKESEKQTAVLQSLLAREDDAKSVKETLLDLSHGMEILPDVMKALQKDTVQTLERLNAMLEESPPVRSREEETQLSKAMEEGISSILGYTAGKVPGVELRL